MCNVLAILYVLCHESLHWRPTSSSSPPTAWASSHEFPDSPHCASACALSSTCRSWLHVRAAWMLALRAPSTADLSSMSSLLPSRHVVFRLCRRRTSSPRCCPFSRPCCRARLRRAPWLVGCVTTGPVAGGPPTFMLLPVRITRRCCAARISSPELLILFAGCSLGLASIMLCFDDRESSVIVPLVLTSALACSLTFFYLQTIVALHRALHPTRGLPGASVTRPLHDCVHGLGR